MSVPTTEEFNALKARVASVETTFEALTTQLVVDQGAILAASPAYEGFGLVGNDQYIVTNLKNYMVKFVDGNGTEHFLGAAGGANEDTTITGLTAQIDDLVTASIVTKAAV